MRTAIITIILLAATTFHASASKVPFINGSIFKAKEKAGTEGKLYFVDFYASWCAPCRLMDETTYEDPAVVQYINAHYIPVKVNIEDFDGYAYKQQYNVRRIPATLIFDSRGRLLEHIEDSLTPAEMLALLKKHNKAYNRKVIIKKKKLPAPKPPVAHSQPAKKPAAKKKKKVLAAGNGLFRFDVKREEASGYSVQIGVFADYANVLVQSEKLAKKYKKPTLVHIATLNDRIVYRVLVGRFKSKKDALSLMQRIKADGGDAVIKSLESLE